MRKPPSLLDRLLESDASVDKVLVNTRKLTHAIAFGVLAGRDAAFDLEDVVQDSLLLALTHRPPDTVENPQAYLARCIQRSILDSMRRSSTYGRAMERVVAARPVESDAPVLDALVHSELISYTLTALETLPATQRRVLKLLHFRHKTFSEIAAMLGISAENARQRASRGHAKLTSLLDDLRAAM